MDGRHVYRMGWGAVRHALALYACLFLFHASLFGGADAVPVLAGLWGGLGALMLLARSLHRVELDGEVLRIYRPGYVWELRAGGVRSWERLPGGWEFHTLRGERVFLEDAFSFDEYFADWLRRFPGRTPCVLS